MNDSDLNLVGVCALGFVKLHLEMKDIVITDTNRTVARARAAHEGHFFSERVIMRVDTNTLVEKLSI